MNGEWAGAYFFPCAIKGVLQMGISFKNYELIMALILVTSVIFMIVAFVKVTLEGEDKKEDDNS